MPDQLHFTDSEEANRLIASDPMALLIGFALDQQITVQTAFLGPLKILERVGSLDASVLASADLDAAFREKPAVHRYPGAMAARVRELAVYVRDELGGDAAAVWEGVSSTVELRERIAALPGFGDMKVKSLGSVLAKQFGVVPAEGLVPGHPTLGSVNSAADLAAYQAAKKLHKAEWNRVKV
jgi:uncharacterized HhH-GPD family protein